MCSFVTENKEEIIVKVVNFAEKEDSVEITLDAPVKSDYIAEVLTGAADAENSLEEPEKIRDKVYNLSGASEKFIYTAPALSVNVLRIKK